MSLINILLFCLLLINSTSVIQKEFLYKDYYECLYEGSYINDTCIGMNPTLESKEVYGSQCCILHYKPDPSFEYKNKYGVNWRLYLKQLFGFTDEALDEMLKSKYETAIERYRCGILPKKLKIYYLYDYSFEAINTTLRYDCGDGEQNFIGKDYVPIEEDDKLFKDIIDCNLEIGEKNCYKRASKLYSENSQCCWCEKKSIDGRYMVDSNICRGFSVNEIEEEMKNETLLASKMYLQKYTMTCNCLNKGGKSVKVFANTVTGQITFE